MPSSISEVRAAPLGRFAGHVIGGIAIFLVVAFGAVVLGWIVDLVAAVEFTLWGVKLTVDTLVTRSFYGAKYFILFVDMVLFVAFVGTSGWLLLKEILGWAKH